MTSEMKSFAEVMIPKRSKAVISKSDVLCGRGSIVHKHIGNCLYRRLINENAESYEALEKNSYKYYLALSIVVAIERQGGRFLKRDNESGGFEETEADICWVQISRREAVAKTAQALRDQIQGQKTRSCIIPRKKMNRSSQKARYRRQNTSQESVARMAAASAPNDVMATSKSISSSLVLLPHDSNDHEHSNGVEEASSSGATRASSHMMTVDSDDNHRQHSIDLNQLPEPYPAEEPLTSMNTKEGEIWVPQELESLILSDPLAVRAIASL